MKRLISRLMLALLTFIIGVASVSLWLNNRRPAPTIKAEVKNPEPDLVPQPAEFEPEMSACGYIKGAGRFSSLGYKSSDGVGVGYVIGDYRSAPRANQALGRKLKEAIQIIERGPKLDGRGRHVGERVVAMFTPIAPFQELGSVFWTDGSHFYAIDSPSLKHALEFEKSPHQ